MRSLIFVRGATLPVAVVVLSFSASPDLHARLQPESVVGWNAYVAATERRTAKEVAPADRKAILAGEIVVREDATQNSHGEPLVVPSAMVQHWRGAVLIPNVTLNDVLARLQSGVPKQEDVLQSSVLSRGPDWMRLYLKLQRRKFVTVVYNTEHLVTFRRETPLRASSTSTATRIAELADVGMPTEHELPQGDDRGFLWRLNAYWRYEQVPVGVIAECESISLSRDIPFGVGYVVMPMVRSAASESMARTLDALRRAF
jgi:hypothetical protein